MIAIVVTIIVLLAVLLPVIYFFVLAPPDDGDGNGNGGPKNNAPTAAFTISVTEALHNVPVTFDASGSSDPDGDNLTYSWKFGDASTGAGKVVNHTYSTDGDYFVNLSVYDGDLSGYAEKILKVVNGVPVIEDHSPKVATSTIDETGNITFSVDVTDPNGDFLTYDWKMGDTALPVSGNNYTYTADYNSAGTYNFSVNITDGMAHVGQKWALVVDNVNRGPVIDSVTPTDNVSMGETEQAMFTVTASDPDGDNLTYVWKVNNVVVTGETNDTFTYSTDFDSSGNYTVEIVVSDGFLEDSHVWGMTVLNVNRAPILEEVTPEGDPTINETEQLQFDITASDPDGDTLTYFWTLDDVEVSTTSTYAFETNYTSAGSYHVEVVVRDLFLSVSYEWNITVNNTNRGPTAVGTVDLFDRKVGELFMFNGTASSDPDGDTLTFTWDHGDGNSTTGAKSNWTYADPGQYTVILNVSDGDLWDTDSLVVNVTPSLSDLWKIGPLPDINVPKILIDDVDGDGNDEIVVSSITEAGGDGIVHGNITIFDLATQQQEWTSGDIGGASDFELVDIDADPALEIIVGVVNASIDDGAGNSSISGFAYVFDGASHAQEWKSRDLGGVVSVDVADVDNDASDELVFGYQYNISMDIATFTLTLKGGMIVFDTTFNEEWNSTGWGMTAMAFVGDLDGDTDIEMLVTTFSEFSFLGLTLNYTLLEHTGTTYDQVTNRTDIIPGQTIVENVDGDTDMEVFVAESSSDMSGPHGKVWALNHDLTDIWSTPDIGSVNMMAIGDVDGDTNLELVAGTTASEDRDFMMGHTHFEGYLHIYDMTGTEEWKSQNISKVATIVIGDFVGDSGLEIAVGVVFVEPDDGLETTDIIVIDGVTHEEVAKVTGHGNLSPFAFLALDVDGDGKDDLILGTSESDGGYIYCYKFG
jgi:PKD repeat protein